eukprot:scaffold281197_cov33-Tisochrysis_lutea.AAC.4
MLGKVDAMDLFAETSDEEPPVVLVVSVKHGFFDGDVRAAAVRARARPCASPGEMSDAGLHGATSRVSLSPYPSLTMSMHRSMSVCAIVAAVVAIGASEALAADVAARCQES